MHTQIKLNETIKCTKTLRSQNHDQSNAPNTRGNNFSIYVRPHPYFLGHPTHTTAPQSKGIKLTDNKPNQTRPLLHIASHFLALNGALLAVAGGKLHSCIYHMPVSLSLSLYIYISLSPWLHLTTHKPWSLSTHISYIYIYMRVNQ